MIYIWWDYKGVQDYKYLKPVETIKEERYRQQLIKLKQSIAEKRHKFPILRVKILRLCNDKT